MQVDYGARDFGEFSLGPLSLLGHVSNGGTVQFGAIRAMLQVSGVIVGVGTRTLPEEFAAAREAGFRQLKLFPAVPAGGVGMRNAIGGPLPDVTFCPTGGQPAWRA